MPARTKLSLVVLVALATAFGCVRRPTVTPKGKPSYGTVPGEGVAGEIKGTRVAMAHAEFTGDLAVFEGDGWGFSPSLLIFLFLEDRRPPEGETIVVDPSAGYVPRTPHVHYRWKNPQTGHITSGVMSRDYEMKIEFGSIDGQYIEGRIELSAPEEGIDVSGPFRARINTE